MAATPPVIVGFESGLEYWRKAWVAGNGSAEGPLGQVAPDALLEEFRVNPLLLEDSPFLSPSAARSAGAGCVAGLLGLDAPVSLVVDRPEKRAPGSGVLARTWCRGLSQAMLAHVEDNILCARPNLCFCSSRASSRMQACWMWPMSFAVTSCGLARRCMRGDIWRSIGPSPLPNGSRRYVACFGMRGASRTRVW